MGGNSFGSTTRTDVQSDLEFPPGSLEILARDILERLTNLDPIQRQAVIQAAEISIPGITRAVAQSFPTVDAAVARTAPQLNLNRLNLVSEALQGSAQRGASARQRQAAEILRAISSISTDPRDAATNVPRTVQSQTSRTSQGAGATSLQIANLGVGAAGVGIGALAL